MMRSQSRKRKGREFEDAAVGVGESAPPEGVGRGTQIAGRARDGERRPSWLSHPSVQRCIISPRSTVLEIGVALYWKSASRSSANVE
jgi:hypothetical protein